jgi:hypothetical protein
MEQYMLGTIVFTLLVFLFPTFLVFHMFFAGLQLFILLPLERFPLGVARAIGTSRLYSLLLRLTSPFLLPGPLP